MAYIEPNTTVEFLTVPFDPDYENTMYWNNETEQDLWMQSRVIVTLNRNSYQRKTRGVIRVGWTADLETPVRNSVIKSLYNSNYMRFKNTNYENKWFYAFVKQVEYVNNNTVDVRYEIDVMQTWACDYQLLECFIERQHTITDDIGEHTVPEGLETGPYFDERLLVSSGDQVASNCFEYNPCVILVTTFDSNANYKPGGMIQGRIPRGNIYSGVHYYKFPLDAQGISDLNTTLEAISGNMDVLTKNNVKLPRFLADGVIAIFIAPDSFSSEIPTGGYAAPKVMNFDIRKNGSYLIGSYRPRNKKLMCYPYNFIYITNNQGSCAEYKWEDFSTPLSAQFNVWGNMAPNCGLILTPYNYKGYTNENTDEMLQITGFPQVSWSYDAYKAWVAQNAGTLGATAIGLTAEWAKALVPWIMGAGLTPSVAGSEVPQLPGSYGTQTFQGNVLSGLNPGRGLIAATMGAVGQVFDHSRKPPHANGNGNISLSYQAGYMTFYYYRKFIKEEYAKIIDAYFDMYGYKVNMVGVPNRNARPCYTFIKTVGCAVDGLLPADDAKAIQSIFDKGIRFWKTSATFGVYSPLVNDNEVSITG